MEKKANMITLQCGKQTKEFEVNHAERILRMPKNGGWKLPDNSPYQLDKNNGLITKSNRGGNTETSKG